jgi:hypothetical protein
VTDVEHVSRGGHFRPISGIPQPVTERELACESVYFTLFKLVELAEYEDADAAVQWAQKALELEGLRTGLVEGVEESRSRRFERATSSTT